MRSTTTDSKLERLIALGACEARDAQRLGRRGDIVVASGGTVLRHGDHHEPWSYRVLSGTALLSTDGEAVAVVGEGAWLLGDLPGTRRAAPPLRVVAGTDVELLAFRPRDLGAALIEIPTLLG